MTGKSGLITIRASEVLTKAPQKRGVATIAISDNAVKLTGEKLHPIWWRGRQWAVTEYGIEALDGSYAIAKDRLLEGSPDYEWPQHMSGKVWVDIDEFTTAWLIALLLHGYGDKVGQDVLLKLFSRLPSPKPKNRKDIS